MAKARLQLLLLHFFYFAFLFLSLKDIHLDQKHDRTLLSNFNFCQRLFKTFPFLVLVGLETAAGQNPCMLLRVRLQQGWDQSGLSSSRSSLGLYDKKQLYMQEPVLTLSLKCATRHVCRHFSYEHRQPMICDALYGSSATHWTVPLLAPQFCTCPVLFCRLNFVQFCTNFLLAAFLHKTIFCAHNCTFLHVLRTEGSMWIFVCTGEEAVHLHRAHVHSIPTLMCKLQMITHYLHYCIIWPSMCTSAHLLMTLRLLCVPLPWWTIC